MKRNCVGILYFIVHMLVEIVTFYMLTFYMSDRSVWILMLLYDFSAFVPQEFFGYLRDKGLKINLAFFGALMIFAALFMMKLGSDPFLAVGTLSVGNCLVHVQGAEVTLRSSKGKMLPAALFVAGGSFGVVTGKLMGNANAPFWVAAAVGLLMLVPIFAAEFFKDEAPENLGFYRFANTKFKAAAVIAAATFVVAVRAFMGYGIPTAWNKTVFQTVLLYAAMGVGKAMGGFMIDRFGIRLTSVISTAGALPLLLGGAELMPVSLVGIAFFSMTMAVTLALIVSVIPKYPGLAFGFTTLGLFIGSAVMFFIKITDPFVNAAIITALTVPCLIILIILSAKKES